MPVYIVHKAIFVFTPVFSQNVRSDGMEVIKALKQVLLQIAETRTDALDVTVRHDSHTLTTGRTTASGYYLLQQNMLP